MNQKPYVVAVDFENFFDSIDHMILISRLHHFLHESKTEELIMRFIQSEALINGEIVKVTKGILQGSALSPLLSNFYLCGFDHYLETQEYPFVRFADDCRIFVRDRNSGERVLDDISRWTKENLNLALNPVKSKVARVTEMDFFGKALKTGSSGYTIARKDRKPGNWYAEWTPSPLSFSNGIYHIQEDGILSSRDRTLLFENEDQKIIYPIETVTSINVFGNTIFDKNFFELMNRKHIDVVMFDRNGKFIGTFYPAESASDMELILKQLEIYADEKKRVSYAKPITVAGIRNMMATIRYYNGQQEQLKYGLALQRMKEQIHCVKKARTVNEVMTAEARCRQEYYDCFSDFILNPEFSFVSRTRRPPKDPVNAMMSFGNTYLYSRISSLIGRSRLDNRISFVHSSMRRRNNLCLDLADIYKPLTTDRVLLTLINKRMISPEMHFIWDGEACLLNKEGITLFLREMKRKLSRKHPLNGKNTTYLQVIRQDIQNLAGSIETGERFRPYTGE